MKSGPKQDQEYTDFAAKLGINRSQAIRIGKDQLRKLLAMDEESRRLVITSFPRRSNSAKPKPKSQPKRKPVQGESAAKVEYMMMVVSRRKA